MSSWGYHHPNIPAAADFGLRILQHQSVHNESIVVAPCLLAFTIYYGAYGIINQELAVDKIWPRGGVNDIISAEVNSRIMSPENANFTVENVIYNKWSYAEGNRSIIKNPVTVEEEIEHLNDVYSRKTEGRIKRLYNPNDIEDITQTTTLVCNFKAAWINRFDSSETFEGTFHTSEGSKRNVTFLSISEAVRKYSENDHFEILSLPYDSKWYKKRHNLTVSLSMNIILPKTRFGLAAALHKTNIWAFQALLTNTEDTYIKAIIPKFDIDTRFNFERYFKSEGIESLIAKPPPKDEETVKEEWETYYRERIYRPELQHVYGSAITIGMDENGSHTSNINQKFKNKPTSVHEDTHKKNLKRKEINADHPFVFVVLYGEHPVFVGTHF